jgi:exoribonuclease R
VELKPGLFGLKPPKNLGVYLERRKRKKEFHLVVVTLDGTKEIKRDQVTKRRFSVELDVGEGEEGLVGRLRSLVEDRAEGRLEDQAQDQAAEGWSERRVWEIVVGKVDEPLRPEALAVHYLGDAPGKGDIRRMEKLLDSCRRDGLGFFHREGKGLWRPVSVDEFKAFNEGLQSCDALRKRLLVTRVEEDEEGEEIETLVGLHPQEAGLDEPEGLLLQSWARAISSYVLHDGWRDDVTVPGTAVHTLSGRSYHRFLEHFVLDWTGVRGVSRSSAALQFLVDAGLLSVQEAITLVARRRVLAAPGFSWESPPQIEDWAERYEEPAAAAGKTPELYTVREDLRELESYTIDPPDAKDFDDAVALKDHPDGSATLWVHIADVSHYVEKDSRLDHHARERATSVYLPTGVLPMLPKKLSEDLCSLRAGVDRLAMGVRLEVDPEGRVVGREPYQAVIRVARNVSYQEVDKAIEQGTAPFARLDALAQRMRRNRRGLAIETGELRIRFVEEAAKQVGREEGLHAEGEEGGEVQQVGAVQPGGVDPVVGLTVQVKRSSPATRMIETFMVAANEAVASFVAEHDTGVPFRCHPLPERAKAERFAAEAKVLGLDVDLELPEFDDEEDGAQEEAGEEDGGDLLAQLKSGKLQLGGFAASETIGSKKEEEKEVAAGETKESPGAVPLRGFAQLSRDQQDAYLRPFVAALEKVEALEDEALRDLAYQKLLSTMGRAVYTPDNVGHFGLGSQMYAHFTSPIRRYPDLVLHRQLRWLLEKQAGRKVDEDPPHKKEHLLDFCAHCSGQSQAAERLEWDLLGTCMCFESRRETWAGALPAIVTGITAGGVFLQLAGSLEARLAMRDIPGGPYEVDDHGTMVFRSRFSRGASEEAEAEEAARLAGLDWREMEDPETGEIREVRLRLGDKVRVMIRERDLVDGKVSVRLAG